MSREETGSATVGCGVVRDALPLRGLDLLDPALAVRLEAHLETCETCATEARFVDRLGELRPEAPPSILAGVVERADVRTRSDRRGWGGIQLALSAAAVLALALGLATLRDSPTPADGVWTLALDPEPATWYGDDWMVAGEPVPEALSDDMLEALFEEMAQ